jgi:hypothetical protein
MLPLLFGGLGGVNAGMVEMGLDMHHIQGWRRRDTLVKIAAIVAVMREKQGNSQ